MLKFNLSELFSLSFIEGGLIVAPIDAQGVRALAILPYPPTPLAFIISRVVVAFTSALHSIAVVRIEFYSAILSSLLDI